MKARFKHRQLDQNAIPTTSLADMMFLLLIFFIMTTTLSRVQGFKTDIPAGARGGVAEAAEKTPTLTLHDDRIAINGEDAPAPRVAEYLRGLRLGEKAGDARIVLVATEGRVNYQTYYETLALIQSCSGVVAIVTEDAGGEKRP
jgi:biopolymer transport protein ExbD